MTTKNSVELTESELRAIGELSFEEYVEILCDVFFVSAEDVRLGDENLHIKVFEIRGFENDAIVVENDGHSDYASLEKNFFERRQKGSSFVAACEKAEEEIKLIPMDVVFAMGPDKAHDLFRTLGQGGLLVSEKICEDFASGDFVRQHKALRELFGMRYDSLFFNINKKNLNRLCQWLSDIDNLIYDPMLWDE